MVPLGEMVIIALTELLSTSAQNAGVFRELGGAGLAGKLVTFLYPICNVFTKQAQKRLNTRVCMSGTRVPLAIYMHSEF